MNIYDKLGNLKLNNMSRKINLKKDIYKYRKAEDNLNTQISIDKIDNENKKLQHLKSNIKNKIENAKTKLTLSKTNRVIEFYNALSENEKKEIRNILKVAKKLSVCSLISGVISSLTTCFGIYNQSNTIYIENFLFECIAIILISVFVNLLLNNIVNFYEKFYEKGDNVLKGVLVTLLIIISGYTIYSIFTNYYFWKTHFKGAALILFSCIYDLISIVFAIMANIFRSLKFNKKYLDTINKVFENKENKNENQENNLDGNDIIDFKKKA